MVDRLPKREPTTENRGAKIAGERDPGRSRCQLLDGEPARKEGAADQREEKLGLGSQNSAVVVAVPFGPFAMVVIARTMCMLITMGRLLVRFRWCVARSQTAKLSPDRLLGGNIPIELDPDRRSEVHTSELQ